MDSRKRHHEIVGALRSLRFLAEALENGYRFDDALAVEKIRRVKEAVAVLEREEEALLRIVDAGLADTNQ